VSTIGSGHLEASDGREEGTEEAFLVGRREGFYLRAGPDTRGFGCAGRAALRDERPRKTLQYQTPAEKFAQCVAAIN